MPLRKARSVGERARLLPIDFAAVTDSPRDPTRDPWLRGWPWLHLVVCAVVLLSLYRGALTGPFFSDDTDLILENPVVEGLSPAHLRAIFEPRGTQTVLTGTWAPFHM